MNRKNTLKRLLVPDSHSAVSPILATVLLLGITVVGGGLAFALLSQGSNTASSQNIITVENAQAIKGTSHSDLTATIKNGGSIPWKKIEMTVAKSDLSEPILYEALHENVAGCLTSVNSAGACTGGINGKIDNPLRSQWIAHLDITNSDTTQNGKANKGEGISAGRKFVLSTDAESYRDTLVPKNTAAYTLFDGFNGTEGTGIVSADTCNPTTAGYTDCSVAFKALDSAIKGIIFCKETTDGDATCKVFTHQKIAAPIQSGQSVQIYADSFTKDVAGLNNLKVQNGDGLVVNIVTEGENGSTARYQTVIKVTGI